MKTKLLSGFAAFAAVLFLSGVGRAATITMNPDPVVIDGINGTFTLDLTSGDTTTNNLVFGITGSNPPGPLPAVGLAAIIFNGTSVTSAGVLSDPDNLITGIALTQLGGVAGLLVDYGAPSSATFYTQLGSTPTTATILSLSTPNLAGVAVDTMSWQRIKIDQQVVTFDVGGVREAAVPEPSAALCFAAGLGLVASRLRRR